MLQLLLLLFLVIVFLIFFVHALVECGRSFGCSGCCVD